MGNFASLASFLRLFSLSYFKKLVLAAASKGQNAFYKKSSKKARKTSLNSQIRIWADSSSKKA